MTELSPEQRIVLPSADGEVELRQLVPEDAESYFDLIEYDRDHLRQFGEETGDRYPSADAVRESIEDPPEPDKIRFGIWHGEADQEPVMVGSINLTDMGEGRAAMGWWVGGQHIGHGYAAAAARPLLDYALGTLNYSTVFCKIRGDNEASLRTAERAGFAYASTSEANIVTYVSHRPEASA
jgi:RimJ/RimL family protein N-acetyltransferase